MIIIMLLIKFMYMLRVQMKQNINIFLKNMTKFALKNVKMQRLLLNIQIK